AHRSITPAGENIDSHLTSLGNAHPINELGVEIETEPIHSDVAVRSDSFATGITKGQSGSRTACVLVALIDHYTSANTQALLGSGGPNANIGISVGAIYSLDA